MPYSLLLVALLAHGSAAQAPSGPERPTFAESVQLAEQGREAEALAAFQQLAASNPRDHEARLWIGRLHERMKHPDLAEAVYRSVLLEDAGSVAALLGVASALMARDEPDDAIELLERAEALAPQSDLVAAALGRAQREAGRTARAVGYLERAVALSPTGQHRLALEDARRAYLHRVEIRGFSEDFNGRTPDSHSGELAVSVRLTDSLRGFGRGQVQKKFDAREERGGGGLEWTWRRRTTLRVHGLVGPDARVMPRGDYLGEVEYTRRRATWTGSVRHFDFAGTSVSVVSPSVTWAASARLRLGIRYALSVTEEDTHTSRETGHSVHLRGEYRWRPRLSLLGGYAGGVDDFDAFSIDRIGDFRANGAAAGLRYDLPTLTSLKGLYEHQWRNRGVNVGRVTVSVAQRF